MIGVEGSSELPFGEIVCPIGGPLCAVRAIPDAEALATLTGLPLRYVDVEATEDGAGSVAERSMEAWHQLDPDRIQTIISSDPVGALAARVGRDSLVCMATDNAGDVEAEESVAHGFLRASGATAVLVGPQARRDIGCAPVAVGIEGRPDDGEAVAVARSLAATFDQRLWLVHVVTPPEERRRAECVGDSSIHPSAEVRAIADELGPDVVAGWEVVHAPDAPTGMVAFAESEECGAVVCRCYLDAGPAGAQNDCAPLVIAHEAGCPVVVVQ